MARSSSRTPGKPSHRRNPRSGRVDVELVRPIPPLPPESACNCVKLTVRRTYLGAGCVSLKSFRTASSMSKPPMPNRWRGERTRSSAPNDRPQVGHVETAPADHRPQQVARPLRGCGGQLGSTNWSCGKTFGVELIDLAEVNLPLLDEPLPPGRGPCTREHTRQWSRTISLGHV